MPIQIETEEDGLIILNISGQATIADMNAWEGAAVGAIKLYGKAKALVTLENFQGWEKSPKWGDTSFVEKFDEKIEKVAFVGDPKWKDEVFAFSGKPFRKTQIEFFDSGQEAKARAWLL